MLLARWNLISLNLPKVAWFSVGVSGLHSLIESQAGWV